jgi:tRNA G18 (ribose-2'-O)-methylase SpoU
VLGSEAHGLTVDAQRYVDSLIRIEGGQNTGLGVESLNVAVAAGIIMYRIVGLIR